MGGEGLLGIIGGILAVLLGLLITMIMQLKRDFDSREIDIRKRLDSIKQCINTLVTREDYKEDKKTIELKLDEHGERILILEVKVKEVKP